MSIRPQALIQDSQQVAGTGTSTDAAFVSRRRVFAPRLPPWARLPPLTRAVLGCLPGVPDSFDTFVCNHCSIDGYGTVNGQSAGPDADP